LAESIKHTDEMRFPVSDSVIPVSLNEIEKLRLSSTVSVVFAFLIVIRFLPTVHKIALLSFGWHAARQTIADE
jgi:hypothetical protein